MNQSSVPQDRTVITDDFLSMHPTRTSDAVTTVFVGDENSKAFINVHLKLRE